MFISENPSLLSTLSEHSPVLDHIAVAVADLEKSISWYRDVLGFSVSERRETDGEQSGMLSVVMTNQQGATYVLLQGTSRQSQISRYLDCYGSGKVHHIAIRIEDLRGLVAKAKDAGVEFFTPITESPGILQAFTKREANTGTMVELIERVENTEGFSDEGVQQLFLHLEANNSF